MLRTLYVSVSISIYFIMSLIFMYPIVLMLGKEKSIKFARKRAKNWGKFFFGTTGSKVEVIYKDKESIEKMAGEPFLVIANHQSNMDIPLLLGYFPYELAFVAKKEMETWPIIGLWMKKIKCVFLDRTNARAGIEGMREAAEIVRNGYPMVIFPEGTRSETGEIGEFKKGSFKIAFDSGVKIIPVTIKNNNKIMTKGKSRINSIKDVKLIIDTPVDISNYSREEQKELPEKIREIILNNYNNSTL